MTLILNILKSVLYGLIQGITEFLPISSEAHFALMTSFLPLNVMDDLTLNMAFRGFYASVIPLGCAAAVLFVYGKRLNPFQKNIDENRKSSIMRLWLMLGAASLPGAVLGFFLNRYLHRVLSSTYIIVISLVIFGGLILWIENRKEKPSVNTAGQISVGHAFILGCAQVLAMIPGVSRAAAVMSCGRLQKISPSAIAEFYMFMSVPAIIGGCILALIQMETAGGFAGILVILTGIAGAFVSAVIMIRIIMQYLKKYDMRLLGFYRIALALAVLISVLTGVIA